MSRTMMLMIAIGLSVVTALMLWSYTEEQKKKLLQQYQTVEVVVAAREIPAKSILRPEDVQTELIPMQFVQPGAAYQIDEVVGKVTMVPLRKGMQIVSDVLIDVSALSGLSAVLNRGYRAVTIRVDAVAGVGGHVQPGDYVDILVILPSRDPLDAWTVLAFQGVQVMAVGSRLSVPSLEEVMRKGGSGGALTAATMGSASHITVQLPVEQARDLAVLSRYGTVALALRRFGEIDSVYVDTLRVRDIIRKYRPRVKPRRKIPPKVVEVYRGLARDIYRVRGDKVELVRTTGGERGGVPFHGIMPQAAGSQQTHRELLLQQLGQQIGLGGGP